MAAIGWEPGRRRDTADPGGDGRLRGVSSAQDPRLETGSGRGRGSDQAGGARAGGGGAWDRSWVGAWRWGRIDGGAAAAIWSGASRGG